MINSALEAFLKREKDGSPIVAVKGLQLKKDCVATLGLFPDRRRTGYEAIITLFPSNDRDDCGSAKLDKGLVSALSPRLIAELGSAHLEDLAALHLMDEEMTFPRVFSALLVCNGGDTITARLTEKGYEFEVKAGTHTLLGMATEKEVGHLFEP